MDLRTWLSRDRPERGPCGCSVTTADGRLVVDADRCEGAGRLRSEPDCRETAIRAAGGVDAPEGAAVVVRTDGVERAYRGAGGALLVAAGRFAERVRGHDPRLADRACRDPLAAAREAVGRAGVVADVAAETGLAEADRTVEDLRAAFAPLVGVTVGHWRVDPAVPTAPLSAVRTLPTGATARCYDTGGQPTYHLTPVADRLDARTTSVIEAAADRLADPEGPATPREAVRAAVDGPQGRGNVPVETAAAVLDRHATGYGLLADLLADPPVSDVFLTGPARENPVRVVADGRLARTNVWATPDGPAALASRFRRESGRAFSRATPTLDASTVVGDRRVRVAGLRPPAAEAISFAFRAHDRDRWRLADLVDNGTLTPAVAALLSVAVGRGRSLLIVGPRGAGKTTLLGALLWELPPDVRAVVVEDTPELPVERLRRDGRDVQAVRTGEDGGEIGPAQALRTALRLGDGALVVGEVRGEEAGVLYEAMRVGAASEAVLGTLHGEDARAARGRVVEDLGVAPTAFGATDLVVALAAGPGGRRVSGVEEVVQSGERFESLYERRDRLAPTGRIERGNSRLVAELARPGGSYADVRATLAERAETFPGPAASTGETEAARGTGG